MRLTDGAPARIRTAGPIDYKSIDKTLNRYCF